MGSEQSLGELEGDEGPVPRPPGPRDPLLVLYGAEGLGGGMQWGRELGAISPWLNIEPRRRKWQPTPVFLPGESQGQGSLVGCHLWCGTESDTTEATEPQQHQQQGPSHSLPCRLQGLDKPLVALASPLQPDLTPVQC